MTTNAIRWKWSPAIVKWYKGAWVCWGRASGNVPAGSFPSRRGQDCCATAFYRLPALYGNQTLFSPNRLNTFLLLYYLYSTPRDYFEGHYKHHFNGFFFNKIPLFRKFKFQVMDGHALTTDATAYAEVTLGVENILKVIRVDFATSYNRRGNLNTGFRLRVEF